MYLMWFSNRKEQEYSNISKEIGDVRIKLVEITTRMEALEQAFRSLRGLVNKKLYKDRIEGEEEGINNPVILPYNGTFK